MAIRLRIAWVDRRSAAQDSVTSYFKSEPRMKNESILSSRLVAFAAVMAVSGTVWATTPIQVGASGKTYASSVVQCAADPTTGTLSPVVEAGLFNPTTKLRGTVSLNGALVANVTSVNPSTDVWLADGNNTVVVALNKKTADSYAFTVQPGMCALPDTSGNTFSADGTLEYAASGKSYATVTPGCAWNPAPVRRNPMYTWSIMVITCSMFPSMA